MYLILNKEHLLFTYSKFANCKYEELSYPKTQKMYHPILLTLLKVRPKDSQSIFENETPSSGTSPVASYKEVPPGGWGGVMATEKVQGISSRDKGQVSVFMLFLDVLDHTDEQ